MEILALPVTLIVWLVKPVLPIAPSALKAGMSTCPHHTPALDAKLAVFLATTLTFASNVKTACTKKSTVHVLSVCILAQCANMTPSVMPVRKDISWMEPPANPAPIIVVLAIPQTTALPVFQGSTISQEMYARPALTLMEIVNSAVRPLVNHANPDTF